MVGENNTGSSVSPGAALPERREFPRYPFTATVEMVEPQSQTRIQGRTSDLSLGGCYVDSTSSFPTGSSLVVRLTKDTRSFEAPAQVTYSIDGMGMGIRFTGADAEQISTLEKWVAELRGEMLPESTLAQTADPALAQRGPSREEHLVLSELVMELMRQGVLSNTKCEAMLQKLNRTGRARSMQAMADSTLSGMFPI
jgi:hypothetical protein